MIRADFFGAIRPAFGGKLTAPEVAGMNALLDAAVSAGLADANHVANVMAQVRRETGGHMSPIKETVMRSHRDKNPSDAEVIKRLDRAYAAGKLPWVKAVYWRDGWFGRGPLQVTHRDNYARIGKAIGEDLEHQPDLALRPEIGAKIAVIGMRDGLFTGRKLADYRFPEALDAPPALNPRRIVNGKDGSDAEVARFHRQFHKALVAAGWDGRIDAPQITSKPVVVSEPPREARQAPTSLQQPQRTPTAPAGIVALIGVVSAAIYAGWDAVAGWADYLTFWN